MNMYTHLLNNYIKINYAKPCNDPSCVPVTVMPLNIVYRTADICTLYWLVSPTLLHVTSYVCPVESEMNITFIPLYIK